MFDQEPLTPSDRERKQKSAPGAKNLEEPANNAHEQSVTHTHASSRLLHAHVCTLRSRVNSKSIKKRKEKKKKTNERNGRRQRGEGGPTTRGRTDEGSISSEARYLQRIDPAEFGCRSASTRLSQTLGPPLILFSRSGARACRARNINRAIRGSDEKRGFIALRASVRELNC